MRKILVKILIIFITASVIGGIFACAPHGQGEKPTKIEGELPDFAVKYTTPYGTPVDREDVVIDGVLSEEIWSMGEWKSFTLTSTNSVEKELTGKNKQVTVEMYGFFGQTGVYLAYKCHDNQLYWEGRMQRLSNSVTGLTVYGSRIYGGQNVAITFDTCNVYPTSVPTNTRVSYDGELNQTSENGLICLESFISYEELKLSGAPEKLTVSGYYLFKWTKIAPMEKKSFSYDITA